MDWPIVGLLVGLAGVTVAVLWRTLQQQSRRARAQLQADQTAANARALQRLAADLRRRTQKD